MQEQQRNLILAIVLSVAVLLGFQLLTGKHRPANPPPPAATSPAAPAVATSPVARAERNDTLAEAPRLRIETPRLRGSVSLAGGRLDDLVLADYYETTKHDTPVTLLSPAGSPSPYYFEQGWTSDDPNVPVPTAQTVWTRAGDGPLTPTSPVTLTWDNGAGLAFTRTISVDANYLFTIEQTVTNKGAGPVTLRPYGTIVRINPAQPKQSFGPAAGVLGLFDGSLDEESYKDLAGKETISHQATGGWVGMSDKYWLVTAVPPAGETVQTVFRGTKAGDNSRYSTDYSEPPVTVAPGSVSSTKALVFAGAKEQKLLDEYGKTYGIDRLNRTVDFGHLWFLAQPFFYALDFIAAHVGNFGIAILIFTVLVRLVLFPLQDRSYHQMSRMKDLQPKIQQLKERYPDDREKMQTAMMELYKREKINPAAGCLPIFIQIPIFFALYRVLNVTIEMRQAPFFGWIHDLSAPDPTTVFNLFGLIPFTPPEFLMIGAWPLINGATMFIQQKMSPTPVTDPTQAKIMMALPLVFMLTLAHFPAGLVIYYSWSNLLGIGQMSLIRWRSARRHAAEANARVRA